LVKSKDKTKKALIIKIIIPNDLKAVRS